MTEFVPASVAQSSAEDPSQNHGSDGDDASFRQLLERLPFPVFVFSHRLLWANAALESLLGFPQDTLLDMSPTDLLDENSPPEVQGVLYSPPGTGVVSLRHAEGHACAVELETQPVIFHGQPATLATVLDAQNAERDTTLRMLSKAFETTQLGLTITDTRGKILYTNRAEAEMHGYEISELVGQDVRILAPRELWNPLDPQQLENLRSLERETVNVRRDGTTFPAQLLSDVVTDEQGEPIALVTTCEDITARREAEAETRRLEDQLRQSQKMEAIGQLAGGVAHDFNNLLVVIRGHGELALRHLDDDAPVRAHLEPIRQATERAVGLTRQLLAFSRHQVLEPTDLTLTDLTLDLMDILRRLLGEHIELRFETKGSVNMVHADPGQLEQVIVNLCVNARDAMPDGGQILIETETRQVGRDFCATRPWARQGSFVTLSVQDTGCGMEPEVCEHIFEPFYTTKAVGKGTGLGLATVYGIVKQHRGMIDVDTTPGEGTRVTVFLPRAERSLGTPRRPTPETVAIGGHETILVAEDDDLVLEVVVQVLRNAGYTVLTAQNGQEAVEIFQDRGDIDLVFLDMVMPVMGGLAARDAIRRHAPEALFLLSTGYSSRSRPLPVVGGEETPLLDKPYDHQGLLQRIRSLLDTGP